MTTFPHWRETARRHVDRIHESVIVDGQEFIAAPLAAQQVGISANRIRVCCAAAPGENVVLTGLGGIKFVRLPRHPGDQRAPVYVLVSSIKKGRSNGS